MLPLAPLFNAYAAACRLADRLQAPVALLVRLYLANVFFKSGLTKLQDWETTLLLFTDEYHVPLLPPAWAAVAGAGGELFFPVLLALGLVGRIGALGLFFVNAMAVVSYYHGLNEATLTHHLLWGGLLAMLLAHGPGCWSADALLCRFAKKSAS